MAGPPTEVELKFTLDPAQGPEILAWLGQGRRPTIAALDSTYFDTAGHDLRRARLGLRLRREDGRLIQTVKSDAAPRGALGRGEWSAEVAGPGLDLAAARATPAGAALGAHAALTPQFSLAIERRALEIRDPESVIEACLDSGEVCAGPRRAGLTELELELKSGPPGALFALARRLLETFPVELSAVTKADRGFALAAGEPLAPRHFHAPDLTADMTAGEAFRAMARAALDQIVWNAALIRQTPAPEAIHQARVGARRLRSTLATFKPVIADSEVGTVRGRLRALAHELDPARDLDVFIDGAWGRAGHAAADAPGLEAAHAAAYERARAAVSGAAARTLALDTAAWIEGGP